VEHEAPVALGYPFNLSGILRKRHSLRAELLARSGPFQDLRVALAGGSTTDELAWLLELFLLDRGFKPQFHQLDFNQYFTVALTGCDQTKAFAPQVLVLHVGLRNLPASPAMGDTAEVVAQKVEHCVEHFITAADGLHRHFQCSVLMNNFPYPLFRSLGNLDSVHHSGLSHFVGRLNLRLAEESLQRSYLHIQDLHYLSSLVGLARFYDPSRYNSYRICESFEGSVNIAHNLTKMISAQLGRSKKVLVLDLDNTLWGGVVGDDGPQGLQLGQESPVGEAFRDFQDYVKSLSQRGVVLAVASKNSPESAREGLLHPHSALAPDDFADIQANWERKDHNIVQISQNLNLSLDQFVFLDDNPAERELVSRGCPELTVPNVSEPSAFTTILDREGYFEPAAITTEDLSRSQMYAASRDRQQLQAAHTDYESYLKSLEMTSSIKRSDLSSLKRVSQLINKTNQFNTTTIRCSESVVEEMLSDPGYLCLEGTLTDRFGSHGLITVVIGKIATGGLHLSHWLMSCRVLKRGVELALFEALCNLCRGAGITDLWGYYRKSAKNAMVESLYLDLGFEARPISSAVIPDMEKCFHYKIPANPAPIEHYIRSEYEFHIDQNPGHSEGRIELSRS